MEATRRKRYLKALGVESWVRRDAAAAEPEAECVAALADTPAAVQRSEPEPDSVSRSKSRLAPRVDAAAEPAPAPSRSVPQDWVGLRAAVQDCQACKLCQTRTNTVFGVGPETARLMVVGEGPGADEDAQGEPFVGRAGKLLDEMLAAIGRNRRENVFIANVVKCRPPGNRDPEADEVAACRPYLEQQIRLIRPTLIVALGRVAAQRLLSTDEPLARLRGQTHAYGPERTPLMITYHPAYLLRSPREKAKSWADLKVIWRFLRDQSA